MRSDIKKLARRVFIYLFNKSKFLTLDVEHHAVWDLVILVRHDTRELLFVGLPARYHHKVAPYCRRPILVASLLVRRFAFQPCVPFDHARRLPIGRHTSCDGHFAPLAPSHDGGGCQRHACHWSSCEVKIKNEKCFDVLKLILL